MNEAMLEAAAERPVLTARLAAVGNPASQRIVWRHHFEPLRVEIADRSDFEIPDGPPEQWLGRVDLDKEHWEPDLTLEAPVKVRLSRLSGDLTVMTLWAHHSVGDVSVFLMLQLDASMRYHKRLHGTAPDWSHLASLHSSIKGQLPDIEPLSSFVWECLRQEREYPRRSVTHIAGTPGEAKPISTSGLLADETTTAHLRLAARKLGGSLTDLAVAAAKYETAAWNDSFGVDTVVQRHGIAVNQRGRVAEMPDGSLQNELSLVLVNSRRQDWGDPVALVRNVAKQRRAALELGFDIWMSRVGDRLASGLQVLPRRQRSAFFRRYLAPDHTLMVSNVGVPFPEVIDGKFTGRSMIREVGALEMVATVGRANTTPNVPNLLGLMSLSEGLFMISAGNQANMTAEELTQLSGLIQKRILSYLD